jgi:hypothetical protein
LTLTGARALAVVDLRLNERHEPGRLAFLLLVPGKPQPFGIPQHGGELLLGE